MYKGIILAGGHGTRFYPMTAVYSKQLINIYDKPMIYYPLSMLMMMGIRDILIVADAATIEHYSKLFGSGTTLGLNLKYAEQDCPRGLADALIIGSPFIGHDSVVFTLGDNLFYGDMDVFRYTLKRHEVATIFAYYVDDPHEYGVVTFDRNHVATSLEEKPENTQSNFAIPGLYIYDNSIVDIVKKITPSDRGELEITDVNKEYLKQGTLKVEHLGRGIAWLDTGSPQSLLEASNFIAAIEKRQGLKVGCIEEVALRQRFIAPEDFKRLISIAPKNSQYNKYLRTILKEYQYANRYDAT